MCLEQIKNIIIVDYATREQYIHGGEGILIQSGTNNSTGNINVIITLGNESDFSTTIQVEFS